MKYINILPDAIRSRVLAQEAYLKNDQNYYTFTYMIKDFQKQLGTYNVNSMFKDMILRMYTGLKLYTHKPPQTVGLNTQPPEITENDLIDPIIFKFAPEQAQYDVLWTNNIEDLVDILNSMADTIVSYTQDNLVSYYSTDRFNLQIKAEDDIPFVDNLLYYVETKLSGLYPNSTITSHKVSRIEIPYELENDHYDFISSFWGDNILEKRMKLILTTDMTALFYSVENGMLNQYRYIMRDSILDKIDFITPLSDFSLIQKTVQADENDIMERSLLEIRKFQLDEIITQVKSIKSSIQDAITTDQYRQLSQLHGELRNFATSFNEIVERIYNEPHENLAELQGLIDYISQHIRETEQWLELVLYQNSL